MSGPITDPDGVAVDPGGVGPGGVDQAGADRGRVEHVILVNGEATPIGSGSSVEDLLAQLGMRGRRVAVALNSSVVPRSTYARIELTDGDRIEILEAVGGG